MNWQTLISYAGILILGAVIGWLLHNPSKPSSEVHEVIKYETIAKTDTVTISKTRIIEKPIFTNSVFNIADSLVGDTNKVAYKVFHSVKGDSPIVSSWRIDLKPRTETIIKFITKDSIRTVVNTKYLPKPFFIDEWFYVAIVELAIVIIAIIF
ncbi:hypothetical protein M1146_07730 [Patescibacteria group bacterium]|nr:hypothetical protein [Patescibacteria group bacterium]